MANLIVKYIKVEDFYDKFREFKNHARPLILKGLIGLDNCELLSQYWTFLLLPIMLSLFQLLRKQ